MNSKICPKCGLEKDLSQYGVDKYTKDGYRSKCKKCTNAVNKAYAEANKDIIRARNAKKRESRQMYYQSEIGVESSRRSHLKRNFNITLEDYNDLLELQSGVCAICGMEEISYRNKVLSVDHDHDSGEIRGLLCNTCNRALGLFKDDKTALQKAINYLNKIKNEF